MPYEAEEGEDKNYTEDEMLEYLIKEVDSVDAAKELLSEHGFSLSKGGTDMLGEDMTEEVLELPMGEESEEAEESAEVEAEEIPSPAPRGIPRVNIIELRMNAAKKAVGEDKKDNSKEA